MCMKERCYDYFALVLDWVGLDTEWMGRLVGIGFEYILG